MMPDKLAGGPSVCSFLSYFIVTDTAVIILATKAIEVNQYN